MVRAPDKRVLHGIGNSIEQVRLADGIGGSVTGKFDIQDKKETAAPNAEAGNRCRKSTVADNLYKGLRKVRRGNGIVRIESDNAVSTADSVGLQVIHECFCNRIYIFYCHFFYALYPCAALILIISCSVAFLSSSNQPLPLLFGPPSPLPSLTHTP